MKKMAIATVTLTEYYGDQSYSSVLTSGVFDSIDAARCAATAFMHAEAARRKLDSPAFDVRNHGELIEVFDQDGLFAVEACVFKEVSPGELKKD